MRARGWDYILGALTFVLPLVVFLLTARGGVGLGDSGELAGVAWTLGIAHPTGYPLWTILGHTFSHIWTVGEPVWRLSVMCGVFTAGAGSCLFFSGRELGFSRGASGSGALTFPFLGLVWSTSVRCEVYSLTGALLALFVLAFIRWRRRSLHPGVVFYIAGLALANHMSGVSLLLPFLVFMFVERKRDFKWAWLALVGLSVYLYLPIRSLHEPFFDWGDPQTLTNFLWHITGRQYRVWMFEGGLSGFLGRLWEVAGATWANWNMGLAIPVLGIILAPRAWRYTIVAGALLCGVYLAGYNIPDIGDYFVPLFLLLALAAGFGLAGLRRFSWVGLALPGLLLIFNFPRLNRRGDTFPGDYAAAHLAEVEQGGLLISNYWDLVSPLLYQQRVLGQRQDVVVIDKELLRRSWYIKHIRLYYPELYGCAREETQAFSRQLFRFEHDQAYDPDVIQSAFINMIRAWLTRYPGPRYTAFGFVGEDERQILRGLRLVPQGLCLRVTERDTFFPFDPGRYRMKTYQDFPRTEPEKALMAILNREINLHRRRPSPPGRKR